MFFNLWKDRNKISHSVFVSILAISTPEKYSFALTMLGTTFQKILYTLVFAASLRTCFSQSYCATRACVNQTLNTSGEVVSRGYKSNYGPLTRITANNVDSFGAFGMTKAQYIKDNDGSETLCTGDSSCSQIKQFNTVNLDCHSMNSCSHIENLKATTLLCDGELSCSYSTITQTPNMYGLGAYSMMNANISSGGIDVQLLLQGYYAGFNATFTCSSGDSCAITCQGNGCRYLKTISQSGSTLSVTCDDSDSTYCPINSSVESSIPNDIPWYFDHSELSNEMDEICENAINNDSINHIVYEDYRSGTSISITSDDNIDVICGRGHETFIGISDLVSNDYIICNGAASCPQVEFIKTHILYCATHWGCHNIVTGTGIVNVTGIVYCLASDTCNTQNFYNSEIMYVGGSGAIYNSNFYGIGEIIITAPQYTSGNNIFKSNGTNSHIILLSVGAGYNSYFFCNEGDTCRIDCLVADACSSFAVECDGYCIIKCDNSKGLDCPGTITGDHEIIVPTSAPTSVPSLPTSVPTIEPSYPPTALPRTPISTTTTTTSTSSVCLVS